MKSSFRLPVLVSLVALAILRSPATAEVKIKILEDGSRVMYNDRPSPRAWTPKPSASGPSRADLDQSIDRHARSQRLDPDLVRAVIQVESGFQPQAESHKGAMGLMQLMPETARQLSVSDPWDPEENLRGGTSYLRHLLDLFGGQLELALAGYNAGPESVERYGGIPPFDETRAYVERVLRIYRREPGYVIDPRHSFGRGRKTYLTRDENGKYLLTTTKVANR